MKCMNRNKRLFTAALILLFTIGFTMTSLDGSFESIRKAKDSMSCGLASSTNELTKPSSTTYVSNYNKAANPLAYLFQLLFILFLISPPLIVIMLCKIWKELKKRNDLK